MYAEYFGTKERPFPVHASGTAVYEGQQQKRVLAGLRKALAWPDAVVTLTGPVGTGKTVLVDHALESVGKNRAVARIARLPLARDELLELLLTEFGVSDPPTGRIQRFASFRRLLAGWGQANTRVFVVVEDALYLGTEALVELESLTAADSGESAGVQLLLMGPPELRDGLELRELARLKQRIRLTEKLAPLSLAETKEYLGHALGRVGADAGQVLEPTGIDALHRRAAGIPRMINNLCEAALIAAAEEHSKRVGARHVDRVATEQFGLEAREPDPVPNEAAPAPTVAEVPVPDLIHDTLPGVAALSDPPKPAPWQAAAERMRQLKAKTDRTEPALPTLDETGNPRIELPAAAAPPRPAATTPAKPAATAMPKRPVAPPLSSPAAAQARPNLAPGRQAGPATSQPPRVSPAVASPAAARPAMMGNPKRPTAASPPAFDTALLEPRAPEKLSKDQGPRDTLSVLALEEALLPDTQLLRALEEPVALVEDTAPVPLGLQADVQPRDRVPTERLPTLSDSMRLDHRRPVAGIPAPAAAQGRKPGEPIPEITLDRKLDEHKQEAADKIAAEAAKRAALAGSEAPPGEATEVPAAAPAPVPKPAAQPRPAAAKPVAESPVHRPAPPVTTPPKPPGEPVRHKLDKVAAELGSAKSIEDIDGMAAETLFGEEFSQLAAQVAAMAPPGFDDDAAAAEPLPEPSAAPPPAPDGAATAAEAPKRSVTTGSPAPARPPAPKAANGAQPAAAKPLPKPAAKVPPPADIDESASRRLEMVRALNGQKGISIPSSAEQIVLEGTSPRNVAVAPTAQPGPKDRPIDNEFGSSMTQTLAALHPKKKPAPKPAATAPSPTRHGPQPEPIENQFGLSMTQTLKALSARSMSKLDDDVDDTDDDEDEDDDEPKGGFFSRFRRS